MGEIRVTDISGAPGSASLLISYKDRAFVYDMGFGFCFEETEKKAADILGGEKPEGIILSHSHYDHVMGLGGLAEKWKAPVIAGEYAAYVFTRPNAKRVMLEMDRAAAREFGFPPLERDNTDNLRADKTVKDGEEFELAGMKLRALSFIGHTKCSMGFYHEQTGTLFSSETLGVCTSPKGGGMPILLVSMKEGEKSLEKAAALDVNALIHPHYGLMEGREACREYFRETALEFERTRNIILNAYDKGIETEKITDLIREKYHVDGIKGIYPEKAFVMNTEIMVPVVINEYRHE